MKKTNYYYIDESGHINNDTKVFIHGCIKTDAPADITTALLNLKRHINDEIYFQPHIDKFNKNGFHAVDNHPDIRAKLYSILPTLNYRSYLVIIKKNDPFFQNLLCSKTAEEIYKLSLRKLVFDRIRRHFTDRNVFYVETLEFPNKSLKTVLAELHSSFKLRYPSIDIEFRVVDKNEENLALADYMNYIFFSTLNDIKKQQPRMEENFELIKPKIAVINYLNKNVYLSRKGNKFPFELQTLINFFAG